MSLSDATGLLVSLFLGSATYTTGIMIVTHWDKLDDRVRAFCVLSILSGAVLMALAIEAIVG